MNLSGKGKKRGHLLDMAQCNNNNNHNKNNNTSCMYRLQSRTIQNTLDQYRFNIIGRDI
jgi:hypothetical protein